MKPRRDITLGEMQDECVRRSNEGKTCAGCGYSFVCPVALGKEMCPKLWFLIDPPRFNEAQMALLKVFYDRGFRKVITGSTRDALVDCIREFLGIGEGVTIDLAELLGKEGAKT